MSIKSYCDNIAPSKETQLGS